MSLLKTSLFLWFQNKYIKHQIHVVSEFLEGSKRILDFGCGDATLTCALKRKYPKKQFVGLDVVRVTPVCKNVSFQIYDGVKLPYSPHSFDTIIIYHVFHHCENVPMLLRQCADIARIRIVIIEAVVRSDTDIPGLRILDTLLNFWRPHKIAMPFHFLTKSRWHTLFDDAGLTVETERNAGFLPSWLPIGGTVVFSLIPKKT